MEPEIRIRQYLNLLYGEQQAVWVFKRLRSLMDEFSRRNPNLVRATRPTNLFTEDDVVLITYGDQVCCSSGEANNPLQSLAYFLKRYLPEEISGVHLLPFYPYSSDDGFSVIDYRQVDPALGAWDDIQVLGRHFKLMFDAVINHISQSSTWFQGFIQGDPKYRDYFIITDPAEDLSQVVRPRTLPLLSSFDTLQGRQHVWTTFSEDQIDLNYANPQVLLEIVDVLLSYVEKGAEIIRLDAIAYLWKEPGSTCIHLSQTHAVVKFFRAVLDIVAPQVALITETNVPHSDNISYFGSFDPITGQTDEAQLVYQFPLAPLVVHTLVVEDASRLSAWAAGLENLPSFFNFIASHDGIGMMPALGLLAPDQIQELIDRTLAHGGQVSYKNNPDGTRSVYELNITLFDLLNNPYHPQPELDIPRFLASQVIMLSLAGVPGIYIHSLFGSHNCLDCFKDTGRARSLNREKFDLAALEAELADPATLKSKVFTGYRQLLRLRRKQPAFHPTAGQIVLDLGCPAFAMLRTTQDNTQRILCLVNVSGANHVVRREKLHAVGLEGRTATDLITGFSYPMSGDLPLKPFQAAWLTIN